MELQVGPQHKNAIALPPYTMTSAALCPELAAAEVNTEGYC